MVREPKRLLRSDAMGESTIVMDRHGSQEELGQQIVCKREERTNSGVKRPMCCALAMSPTRLGHGGRAKSQARPILAAPSLLCPPPTWTLTGCALILKV